MSDPILRLLARIEAHCEQREIALSTFGKEAVNDGKLVSRLRNGRSITVRTLEAIEAKLSEAQTEEGAA